MTRAFITGITGQDGSYLAELLLGQGYEVHGLVRSGTKIEQTPLAPHTDVLGLHVGDLVDGPSLARAVAAVAPDEIYHLGGQTHVGGSFEAVEETLVVNGLATVRLLEAVRAGCPKARFFNAASSEVFGCPSSSPQDEVIPFAPVTPYGCAKALGAQMVRQYRETHGLYAVNGILYNHESPRRLESFVTQKICRAAAAIKLGGQKELRLGDLAAERDWSDARDVVRGVCLALREPKPADYVFASGETHSVQEVVEIAFETVDVDWRDYVKRDQSLLRPAEPNRLVGDASRAREKLGWDPETDFRTLIISMTHAALLDLRDE
ncbi:MAG: GDP-mannose 4,6-dehydratase [Verrucomicrobiales bacterium]|nr:GDP-mannose 4,6-dehydratase [Verrucomicrobiales bacterium]